MDWGAVRSISSVSGRFKARADKGEPSALTMQEATMLQERAGRYLIDETTAITRQPPSIRATPRWSQRTTRPRKAR